MCVGREGLGGENEKRRHNTHSKMKEKHTNPQTQRGLKKSSTRNLKHKIDASEKKTDIMSAKMTRVAAQMTRKYTANDRKIYKLCRFALIGPREGEKNKTTRHFFRYAVGIIIFLSSAFHFL